MAKKKKGFGPDLPFLAFFGQSKENHRKKTRIFSLLRTPKIPEKEGKTLEKAREFLATKKSKEIQKSKERKIRDLGSFFFFFATLRIFSG